ncbi:YehR family protein [Erysipelothrix sp. HDW6C]|uniref:DUF1307 domain-containing protein n=1 Tax=Erysipelothrix sp. HDW6C TaxID=2714930 RepID=UPI0014094576|nr:DUF1307 domain-containing protein [Erysipelothrix sp. HDW6C]QIK68773.1 YehR family protein [Erysipelothrix sp. HDW6C]
MKKLIVTLFAVLVLVGCGSKEQKEVVTVCSSNEPYAVYESGEQTYTSKGDVITKLNIKAVLDAGDKETLDTIMGSVDKNLEEMNKMTGVKLSVERIDDTKIYDIAEFDLEIADLQELSSTGMIQLDGDEKVAFVSLKQSIANIESMGFTCKAN